MKCLGNKQQTNWEPNATATLLESPLWCDLLEGTQQPHGILPGLSPVVTREEDDDEDSKKR